MIDPYSTLGLKPNATDAQVKRAYKKLSMKHHPDRGGDAEKFKDINEAYEQIINGGIAPDNSKSNTITELIELFNAVVKECAIVPPHRVDIARRARTKIEFALIEIDRIKQQQIADLEIYEKLRGRMSTTNTDNAFEMLIDAKLGELNKRITVCDKDTIRMNALLEVLGDYHFDVETENVGQVSLPESHTFLIDTGLYK